MQNHHKYDEDFYAWTMAEANLLRNHKFDELDIDHLIEELIDMGESTRRELESRLIQLLMHLLKWEFQPSRKGKSWENSIKKQRIGIRKVLRKNPSLKSTISECIVDAYQDARYDAANETELDEKAFPQECPYTFEQIMNDEFYPE